MLATIILITAIGYGRAYGIGAPSSAVSFQTNKSFFLELTLSGPWRPQLVFTVRLSQFQYHKQTATSTSNFLVNKD